MRELKKYLFLIVALALFICPMQVQAAKKKDIKQITKQVNSYMSAVKKYDIKKIKKDNNNIPVYHWTGKKMQKHIRSVNQKHLSYTIKKITVKGDSATAVLRVYDYSLYEDSRTAMYNLVYKYNKKWDSKKTVNTYVNLMIEAYNDNIEYYADKPDEFKVQCIFERNTRIPLKKINGKWKISKITKAMLLDLDGGSSEFIDDFKKDPTIIF